MESAEIDSPRGKFTLSKAHNPVQDIYLRKVEGNENKVCQRRRQGARRSGARLQDGVAACRAPPTPRPRRAAQRLRHRQARAHERTRSIARQCDRLPTFLDPVLNGVQYGLLLFLVASGLTLIFGIMGMINLAHGSFYMVGAYLAFSLAPMHGSLWLAILRGRHRAAVVFGLLLEWLLFSPTSTQRDHLYQVLLTFGLILIFEELRSILFGDDVHGVAVPAFSRRASLPLDRHAVAIRSIGCSCRRCACVVAGALYLLIQRRGSA